MPDNAQQTSNVELENLRCLAWGVIDAYFKRLPDVAILGDERGDPVWWFCEQGPLRKVANETPLWKLYDAIGERPYDEEGQEPRVGNDAA